MDKGKAKMAEYVDDHFDDDESTHSLNSEFGSFEVPIGAKKALISANEKLRFASLNTKRRSDADGSTR